MKRALIVSLAFAFSLLPCLVTATDITALNPVQTLEIRPKNFKAPMRFNITLPQGYEQDKEKGYFVIFDIHPRSQPFLSGMHDWLSHNGEWPWLKSIVVTPTGYNPEFNTLFDGLVKTPENQAMLDLLEFDLLKAVDKKYRTNGFRIYNGFMSNGALGLYTLLNRPRLFNAYIISSPTLTDNFANVTTEAESKLAKLDDKPRFLYLSIGNHGYEKAHIPSFTLFEKALQKSAPKQLDWRVVRNTENYYMSRPILGVLNGIEALFDDIHTDLAPDSDISRQGVGAIIRHYETLSRDKYGFEVSAEGSLKKLAKSMIASAPEQALAIYQKTVNLYPESAYALYSLASAYAKQGNFNKAVSYQTQAVEKSKAMVSWHQNKHQEYLDKFKEELNKISGE